MLLLDAHIKMHSHFLIPRAIQNLVMMKHCNLFLIGRIGTNIFSRQLRIKIKL